MGFLIRIALLLGLVILFIPADEAETKKLGTGQSVSLFDTLGFASAAYSDARGFCDRNPNACSTGGGFMAVFQAKARTGARWVYSYLDPQSGEKAGLTRTPKAGPSANDGDNGQPVNNAALNRHAPEPLTFDQRRQQMLATGSLAPWGAETDEVSTGAAKIVSIHPRAHGDFLPLPPAKRPS